MAEARQGTLDGLEILPGEGKAPAAYRLNISDGADDHFIALNDLIGSGVTIEFLGDVECRHCGALSKRSFGGGYCYDCFSTLARCDLCVVSPDRCHYHAGTCREPAWAESFCMQPHVVYLANSSGAKVGITRQGREVRRWLDQGAIQGLAILEADTRRDAGLAEVKIGEMLNDRTDWRKMLRADVPELDLDALRERVRSAGLSLPDGVRWLSEGSVRRFHYPMENRIPPAEIFRLEKGAVRGNLKGMKAQYLLIGAGAFNVRQHAGFRVTVHFGPALEEAEAGGEQLGLF